MGAGGNAPFIPARSTDGLGRVVSVINRPHSLRIGWPHRPAPTVAAEHRAGERDVALSGDSGFQEESGGTVLVNGCRIT